MKNYDETVSTVFDRIHDYNVKKKRRTVLACRITAACCAVSLLGGSVWYLNRPTHDIPVTIAPDDDAVTTTVTTAPTEGEDTTTTTTVNTTAPEPTTDGGIVTPPTTAPSKTTTTVTSKVEETKTTTTGTKQSATGYIPPIPTTTQPTAGSDKLLITGDEPDNNFNDAGMFHKNEKYISRSLQEQMDRYKGVDATYAVSVLIPTTHEDIYEDFWASTEELVQFRKEYQDACDAYREEAWQLNPSWDGKSGKTIEVWTDSLREKYEYWLSLIEKDRELEDQPRAAYLQSVLDQRFEAFEAVCDKEPIVLSTGKDVFGAYVSTYYAELTAEQINTLAVKGGYVFRLASGEPKNPVIDA